MPENRLKTGQFTSGRSGNPGGRPKKSEPERKAEELFSKKTPHAAKALLDMAEDTETPAKVRVDIYKYVIDRALGKPRASGEIELSGEVALVNVFDPETRAALLASIGEDDD